MAVSGHVRSLQILEVGSENEMVEKCLQLKDSLEFLYFYAPSGQNFSLISNRKFFYLFPYVFLDFLSYMFYDYIIGSGL